MVVAEECLARGLAVDHAQSICWAITFNLCPVAIWIRRYGKCKPVHRHRDGPFGKDLRALE